MFSARRTGIDLRHVVVLAANSPDYAKAAQHIVAALERAGCDRVETAASWDRARGANGATVIALGSFVDNDLIRSLYFEGRDVTDRAWPGAGGWAVRCVDKATADGGDALLLSVSDSRDAGDVADRFEALMASHGLELPWVHEVSLGKYGQVYLDQIRALLPTPDTSLDVIGGGSGDWDYMMAIGKVGVLGAKTGDAQLIVRFATELLRFLRVRFFERELEDPIQIHGFLRNLLRPFALLEHHPALTDALRLQVLEGLISLYRSAEGAANPAVNADSHLVRVRQNHGTRTALDIYDGGLYFKRQHGLAEADAWMTLAERYFQPQLESAKPVCDSWGHQWNGSLCNTAEFALLAGKFDYFESDHFVDAVERALIAHTNLETGPPIFLLLAAAVTGNNTYLVLSDRGADSPESDPGSDVEARLIARALAAIGGDEFGRSWVTGADSEVPDALTGLSVSRVARLFYESIEEYAAYAPPGIYVRDVEIESAFDKIAYRSGWGEQDTYLLLDGISGGSHSYQDANCLVRLTGRGKTWFGGPQYGRWTTGTVREQNGVSISIDGEGAGCESRYARLHRAETADGAGLIHSSLDTPGVGRWHRQIVTHPDGWILVCDEVVAAKAGEMTLQAQWNLIGEVTSADEEGESVRSIQEDVCLTLCQSGSDTAWLSPVYANEELVSTRWNLRRSRQLETGESMAIVTLLDLTDAGKAAAKLRETGSAFQVETGRETVRVSLEEDAEDAAVDGKSIRLAAAGKRRTDVPVAARQNEGRLEPTWQKQIDAPVSVLVPANDSCLVGTRKGDVLRLGADADVCGRFAGDGEVSALVALADGGAIVGRVDGALCRYDADGAAVWHHRIEWQPMNWDNWTRGHCAVLDLAVGEFGGTPRIVAGCADRHLYGFSIDGDRLWRSPCLWGPASRVSTACIGPDGERRVLVGMARPAIHAWCRAYDADGQYLRALERPDIVSWSIPSWMTEMSAADLDGDGQPEVLVGMDTNHKQLVVYDADGSVRWDADVGSAVSCLEIADGNIAVGTRGGWVHVFDPEGRRMFSRDFQRSVCGLAPLAHGRIVAAMEDGRVCALDENGVSVYEADERGIATSVFWPDHGLLVVTDEDSSVCLFA